MDTTKIQLGESVCFIGVTYIKKSEGLLTGTDMSQRQLDNESLPQQCRELTKAGNLEYTAQAAQQVSEHPFRQLSWSEPFLGIWVGFCLPGRSGGLRVVQAPWLV